MTPHDGAVSLFYLNDGRESIRFAGDRATVGDRETTLTALVEEAERAPEHFSPNVLLRPIVQDTLFPTICYVAGPNELAYLGQLRDVYTHFDVPMPLMYQRATATIVDSATLRFLTKYELPLEALQPQDEAALNQLLQDQLPPTVEQALTSVSTRRSRSGWRAVAGGRAADRSDARRHRASRRSAGCSTICGRCTTR